MKKFKRIFAVSALLLTLGFVTACGNNDTVNDATKGEKTTDEKDKDTTDRNNNSDNKNNTGTTGNTDNKDNKNNDNKNGDGLGDAVDDITNGVGEGIEDVGDGVGDALGGDNNNGSGTNNR